MRILHSKTQIGAYENNYKLPIVLCMTPFVIICCIASPHYPQYIVQCIRNMKVKFQNTKGTYRLANIHSVEGPIIPLNLRDLLRCENLSPTRWKCLGIIFWGYENYLYVLHCGTTSSIPVTVDTLKRLLQKLCAVLSSTSIKLQCMTCAGFTQFY